MNAQAQSTAEGPPETTSVLVTPASASLVRSATPARTPRARGFNVRRILLLLLAGALLAGAIHLGRWALGLDTNASATADRDAWTPLQSPQGLGSALLPSRAVALAPGPGGTADVHLSWVRTTPEGEPLSVWGTTNVTRSPAVAESRLVVSDHRRIAYASRRAGPPLAAFDAVEVLLLEPAADSPSERDEGSWAQGTAATLTSLELWGQRRPPRRIRVELAEEPETLDLQWQGSELHIETERGTAVLDTEAGRLLRGEELATITEQPRPAAPDLFRWAVDQLRYSRFVGPDRLQRLEQLYLEANDAYAGLTENRQPPPSAAELTQHLGRPATSPRDLGRPWPPAAIAPLLDPPLEGEGQWRERDERFLTPAADGPPLFYTTFLRTEPERPRSSRVFFTVWDPAWLELDWVAGTMEPRSTIGLNGTGQVPAKALKRLVAGFNGGFQAVDGAFGMKTRAGPFLPPVAYGATIARLDDGRIGLGTWPDAPDGEMGLAAYRQNLTALIEHDEVNPYGRRFWGGVPATLADTTRTDRTGLCLTEESHLAYFWGRRVTVAGLARAMEAASCEYAMLLDINFSNTVFETYRIAAPGELPPLDRALDEEWEREGAVPGSEELVYRVQAMAPGMTRVGFPRYIRTELRDFFYLTLRPEALGPPAPGLCELSPLPDSSGTPPRAWRCEPEPSEGEARELFVLDTRRLRLQLAPTGDAASHWVSWPVSRQTPGPGPTLVLSRGERGGTVAAIVDGSGESNSDDALLFGGADLAGESEATSLAAGPGLVAAVAPQGPLALVSAAWPGCRALWPQLRDAGFTRALFIPAGADAAERLVANADDAPMAVRIFDDTRSVPQRVWGPHHRRAQQRIDELGLTRHYVQIRHYLERDRPQRR